MSDDAASIHPPGSRGEYRASCDTCHEWVTPPSRLIADPCPECARPVVDVRIDDYAFIPDINGAKAGRYLRFDPCGHCWSIDRRSATHGWSARQGDLYRSFVLPERPENPGDDLMPEKRAPDLAEKLQHRNAQRQNLYAMVGQWMGSDDPAMRICAQAVLAEINDGEED